MEALELVQYGLLYTFAAWGVWKVVDGARRSWQPECPDCIEKEKKVKTVIRESESVNQMLKRFKTEETHRRAIAWLNEASEEELDEIYGVGQATARKIIGNRPYQKLEDIKESVGPSIYYSISTFIRDRF